MRIRSLSRAVLPATLLLCIPAVHCGGGVASEQAASADSAMSRAPVATSAHGRVRMAGDALGDVPLTQSQRSQIEKLAMDADANHAGARAAHTDLMVAVADQVQLGRIDRAALQPRIDALAAALQKAQPADRASLEQLHALLNADQRVAFVDALEVRIGGHRGAAGKRHPLQEWADDLKLTDEQRTQIRAALRDRFLHTAGAGATHASGEDHGAPRWSDAAGHGAKVLAAFKKDRFVMDEVAPQIDLSQVASRLSDRVLGLAETVLPLLTPEQRTVAAQKIREKLGASGEMVPGF